jgi:hypothetical protein
VDDAQRGRGGEAFRRDLSKGRGDDHFETSQTSNIYRSQQHIFRGIKPDAILS